MQQMNNILLAPNLQSTAAASKISLQEPQSGEFSAAMASVVVSSETSTISKVSSALISAELAIPALNIVTASSSGTAQLESSTDDTELGDGTEIQAIFAQIDMAHGMKKAQLMGDSLPLATQLTAVDDPAQPSLLSESSALGAEESTNSPFLAEQVNLKLAAPSENIASAKQTYPIDIQRLSVTENASSAVTLSENDRLAMAGQANLASSLTAEPSLVANPSLVGEKSEWQSQPSKPAVSTMASVAELRTATHMANQSSGLSGLHQSEGADGAAVNRQTKDNANNINILTSASGVMSSVADPQSDTDIALASGLKAAKLAVAFDKRQENTFDLLDTGGEEATAEFKSVAFKALTPAHVLVSQPLHRQDIPLVQPALRLGEPQNSMQEMIQRFSPLMGQQLLTMVSQGIQQAEIRLDPPELGQMLVKIQVQGDQTQVQFHVTQSQTRELVEQAIPRLRELLQEQGMQLADSHVSQGDQGQRQGDGSAQAEASGNANVDNFSAEELDLGANQATSLNSTIDYYA